MRYEWDGAKSETNRRNRGFGFEIMEDFIWEFALNFDSQIVEGEQRDHWIGPIGGNLYSAITTDRGLNTRIISLRRATSYEIKRWKEVFQDG